MTVQEFIEKYPSCCKEAQEWMKGYTEFADAWHNCQRGDWVLWAAHALGLLSEQRLSVLVKARVVETIKCIMPIESIEALDVFIGYGEGVATLEEFEVAKEKARNSCPINRTAHISAIADIVYHVTLKGGSVSAPTSHIAKSVADAAYHIAYTASYANEADARAVAQRCFAAGTTAYNEAYTTAYAANQLETANIIRSLVKLP